MLTTLGSTAWENRQLVAVAVGVAAVVATTAVYYALNPKDREDEFPMLRGIQLYHTWNFFRRRHDFLLSNYERNLGKSFSFNLFHHKVIALTGEDARQTFFSNRSFSIDEGHKILIGNAPLISAVDDTVKTGEEGNVAIFNRKLNKILNRTRLQDVLPTLLKDIFDTVGRWGENGRIDPFVEIFELVLVMTARLTTCHELTENKADLKKIGELIFTLQTSTPPVFAFLPWFPSSAGKIRKEVTTELFTTLLRYVEGRRRAEPTNDAIDILIADGDTTHKLVGYLMAMFFVAVGNTGIAACWMLIDLATHPEWREKCGQEIKDLISRHPNNSSSPTTLYEKLKAIPISAWEDDIPTLDACIRESQRISTTITPFRRNIGEDTKIGGRVVRRGDFLVYPPRDAHLNPEYYPEPHKYDPGRWLRPDPVPDAAFPFLSWGAGRHPCTGMKTAKLEMKMILAVLLMGYEYEIVDKDGKFPNPLPVPDMNDSHRARPLGATYYFNFKKTMQ